MDTITATTIRLHDAVNTILRRPRPDGGGHDSGDCRDGDLDGEARLSLPPHAHWPESNRRYFNPDGPS
jgi:hypothetical protein